MRTHGRIATYNHGCHCDDCKAEATRRRRLYRFARLGRRPNGYCPVCDEWMASPHGQVVHEGIAHRSVNTPTAG